MWVKRIEFARKYDTELVLVEAGIPIILVGPGHRIHDLVADDAVGIFEGGIVRIR